MTNSMPPMAHNPLKSKGTSSSQRSCRVLTSAPPHNQSHLPLDVFFKYVNAHLRQIKQLQIIIGEGYQTFKVAEIYGQMLRSVLKSSTSRWKSRTSAGSGRNSSSKGRAQEAKCPKSPWCDNGATHRVASALFT